MNYKRAFYILLVVFLLTVIAGKAFARSYYSATLDDVCSCLDNIASQLSLIDSELSRIKSSMDDVESQLSNIYFEL